MSEKMVPISTRVRQEDVEFISQLSIAGATTPSDKLRVIIADARRRAIGMQDYSSGFQLMQESFAPVRMYIREAELKTSCHSELVTRLIEWLPDMVAYLMSTMHRAGNDIDEADLKHLEQGATDRIFRLMESVMQMGVTQLSPCYDPSAIAVRIEPILELARVIIKQTKKEESAT